MIPLTYKQLKGMRAMQALQPQIKELQAKYKNDRQRMQQEMMKFYQENNVNPFASCIPLIAQLPVFITLFYTLRHELPGRHRLHCRPLRRPGVLPVHPRPDRRRPPGPSSSVLLVLYVGTQLISGLVMSVTADKTQRRMMMILPFVFVPFVITFPAGLVLYWITTNVWTIGQQYVIQRVVPAPTVPAGAAAAVAKARRLRRRERRRNAADPGSAAAVPPARDKSRISEAGYRRTGSSPSV